MRSAEAALQSAHFTTLSTLPTPITDGADPQRELPYIVIGAVPSSSFTGAQDLDGEEILASVEIFASRKSKAKQLKTEVLQLLHRFRPELSGFSVIQATLSSSALQDVSSDGRSVYKLTLDFLYTVYNT